MPHTYIHGLSYHHSIVTVNTTTPQKYLTENQQKLDAVMTDRNIIRAAFVDSSWQAAYSLAQQPGILNTLVPGGQQESDLTTQMAESKRVASLLNSQHEVVRDYIQQAIEHVVDTGPGEFRLGGTSREMALNKIERIIKHNADHARQAFVEASNKAAGAAVSAPQADLAREAGHLTSSDASF